jgi:hypothetical protein
MSLRLNDQQQCCHAAAKTALSLRVPDQRSEALLAQRRLCRGCFEMQAVIVPLHSCVSLPANTLFPGHLSPGQQLQLYSLLCTLSSI